MARCKTVIHTHVLKRLLSKYFKKMKKMKSKWNIMKETEMIFLELYS